MIKKRLLTALFLTVSTAAFAFPPFTFDGLKLSNDEFILIDSYYKKFNFLDVAKKRLLMEVKAASIGKYTNVCGDDTPKWQALTREMFSTEKFDAAIFAVIDQTNAQESLTAHSTIVFRETIKSKETQQHLDQLEANSTTQLMFFSFVAGSWVRSYADPELAEIAEKFLRGHCGPKKRTPTGK